MDLLDELQTRVLCGDGAIGTLLLDAGIPLDRCFEELCLSEPDRIEKIHQQYIAAGARVIETNTFGANAVRLEKFRLEGRVTAMNYAAAQLAVRAARGKNVYVAGSVGPLGLGREEAMSRGIDRGQCFREQISGLIDGGADCIFFETFIEFEEMEIAFRSWKEIDNGLAICSFACAPDGLLSSGMPLVDAFAKLRALGAKMLGVNCMNDPSDMERLVRNASAEYPHAVYPSAGLPRFHQGRFIYDATPQCLGQAARKMVAQGAGLIGGCCGTTPAHIAAIADTMANMQPVRSPGAG
jgi:homocysteine S-methyltransferase